MKLTQLMFTAVMFLSLAGVAQSKADSAALAKAEKQKVTIETRLKSNQEKLARLEQELIEKQAARDKAVTQAEESADENRRLAVQLSNDPSNKKKARRADNASGDARKDAKRARIATSNLQDVENDIKSIKKKIAEDEKRLNTMSAKTGN